MIVRPSRHRDAWRAFQEAPRWDPQAFAQLVADDDIGEAAFEVETMINGMYRAAQRDLALAQRLGLELDPDRLGQVAMRARWLEANFEPFRERIGAAQRELDLQLMRAMRRASCLSVVIGAGATMDAGGPSWPALVKRLLQIALERGRERSEMRPSPDHQSFTREVRGVEHLDDVAAQRARDILALIDARRADTDALMEGAQLCYDFLGQHLFTDITGILYEGGRTPGPIHRAIAELAGPVVVPDRGGTFRGWHAIVTYNFDDLMGEALDDVGEARAAYAMRGDEIAGDPNARARLGGPQGSHHSIFHLHGYTPRKLFLITSVRFVFSTSQYAASYGGARNGVIGKAFAECLANPVHHALYVGCSFADEAMNALLRDAAQALPGRSHYALLKWPGRSPVVDSTADEVALESATYRAMGVRPIWFDSFDEIPVLIRQLA